MQRYIYKIERCHIAWFLVFGIAALFLFAGCVAKSVSVHNRRFAPTGHSAILKPIPPSDVGIGTPARSASQKLVENGKLLFSEGKLNLAASSFSDAISVDSTNGQSYYYLALVYANLGRMNASLGILDKAEQLLGYDKKWEEKITQLRSDIQSKNADIQKNDNFSNNPEGAGVPKSGF